MQLVRQLKSGSEKAQNLPDINVFAEAAGMKKTEDKNAGKPLEPLKDQRRRLEDPRDALSGQCHQVIRRRALFPVVMSEVHKVAARIQRRLGRL